MAGLKRLATPLAWLAFAAALIGNGAFFARWGSALATNAKIRDRSIETMQPLPSNPRARYAAAYWLERSQHFEEAAKLLNAVRATDDPALAADAWFALGNAYFSIGIRASRESTVGGSIAEAQQFDLARDAYRAALRIRPDLHGARYNLELLERLSPRRPDQGWRRNTDPITIPPDRHNGWTTIQETPKRGLP